MAWMWSTLCLLLPAALFIKMAMTAGFAQETVLTHEMDPDPGRQQYIWNPFHGLCGNNATRKRCAGVCPETCAFKSLKCYNFCGVNCVCKTGYVFDENLKLCILKSECAPGIKQTIVEIHRVFQ